jgi:hypothetical protein
MGYDLLEWHVVVPYVGLGLQAGGDIVMSFERLIEWAQETWVNLLIFLVGLFTITFGVVVPLAVGFMILGFRIVIRVFEGLFDLLGV